MSYLTLNIFSFIDPESLDMQGSLDPNDELLDLVRKWEILHLMVIYQILTGFSFFSFLWVCSHSFFFLKRVYFLC